MNLVIDIGNTRVKAALFKENNLFKLNTYSSVSDVLLDFDFINQAKNAVVASVVNGLEQYYKELELKLPTLIFTSVTKIPLVNLYQSPSSLGSDRVLASVGAFYLYQKTNVLVIDAGTCIKYNFTNSKNEYLGGGISPGIQMRFKALSNYTSKLPLVAFNQEYTELIGSNTENSILSGVLNGTVAEIDEIINQYKLQFPDIKIVLTGGDSDYLAKRLKNSIFTHQNLVLIGLNNILNYNLEHN